MVIDTSAVLVILLDEPEQDVFTDILTREASLTISAITFYESAMVMAGKKQMVRAARLVDDFIRDLQIDVAPLSVEDALAAREAYLRYGKSYHPAGLNFADCFAYALAKRRNEPLLFKGDDFSKTDLVPAWRPSRTAR